MRLEGTIAAHKMGYLPLAPKKVKAKLPPPGQGLTLVHFSA